MLHVGARTHPCPRLLAVSVGVGVVCTLMSPYPPPPPKGKVCCPPPLALCLSKCQFVEAAPYYPVGVRQPRSLTAKPRRKRPAPETRTGTGAGAGAEPGQGPGSLPSPWERHQGPAAGQGTGDGGRAPWEQPSARGSFRRRKAMDGGGGTGQGEPLAEGGGVGVAPTADHARATGPDECALGSQQGGGGVGDSWGVRVSGCGAALAPGSEGGGGRSEPHRRAALLVGVRAVAPQYAPVVALGAPAAPFAAVFGSSPPVVLESVGSGSGGSGRDGGKGGRREGGGCGGNGGSGGGSEGVGREGTRSEGSPRAPNQEGGPSSPWLVYVVGKEGARSHVDLGRVAGVRVALVDGAGEPVGPHATSPVQVDRAPFQALVVGCPAGVAVRVEVQLHGGGGGSPPPVSLTLPLPQVSAP
jgi:hypothetical protein